jgi:hypothetical protein
MQPYFSLAIYRYVNSLGSVVMVPLLKMNEEIAKKKGFVLRKTFYGLTARECQDLHGEIITHRWTLTEQELLSRLESIIMNKAA